MTTVCVLFCFLLSTSAYAVSPPYPQSSEITGISYDWSEHKRLAIGSDNWPIAWSNDDSQYTFWGDGGGFGGTNDDGRVSLGLARVIGGYPNFTTANVWGGKNAENPAQFDGKVYGIISVGGILYGWWGPGSGNDATLETRIIRSTDEGATWTKSSWRWTASDNLYLPSFLNFGKDNAGARDNYVYSYAPRGQGWQTSTHTMADLARVPSNQIMTQSAYEWFAGFAQDGTTPLWTSNMSARKPVFQDPNHLNTVSVTYNSGLDKYLLTSGHSVFDRTLANSDQWGLYEADNPWGPWKTVAFYSGNDNWGDTQGIISMYFAPRWWSADGKSGVLIYTDFDAWGSVPVVLTVSQLTNLQAEELFLARLGGLEEVPSVSTDAGGSFIANLIGGFLDYSMRYDGIETPVLFAHIHLGQARTNGGVSVFLCDNTGGAPEGTPACPPMGGEVTGSVSAEDVIGPEDQGIAPGEFEALVAALREGETYVNVHSEAFPSGEIRGQIR